MPELPTEAEEQMALIELLDTLNLVYFHSPSEGIRKVQYIKKLEKMGFSGGFPDIIIFDTPPSYPAMKGLAIEMKRAKGGKTSEKQLEWLEVLSSKGWISSVCKGLDEAIDILKIAGYTKRS